MPITEQLQLFTYIYNKQKSQAQKTKILNFKVTTASLIWEITGN